MTTIESRIKHVRCEPIQMLVAATQISLLFIYFITMKTGLHWHEYNCEQIIYLIPSQKHIGLLL